MQIAHGVHHEDVDVRRQQEHILDERSEHVPGFEVHKGRDKVHPVRREHGDDDFLQGAVFREELGKVFPFFEGVRDGEVDGVGGAPGGDDVADAEEDDGD